MFIFPPVPKRSICSFVPEVCAVRSGAVKLRSPATAVQSRGSAMIILRLRSGCGVNKNYACSCGAVAECFLQLRCGCGVENEK